MNAIEFMIAASVPGADVRPSDTEGVDWLEVDRYLGFTQTWPTVLRNCERCGIPLPGHMADSLTLRWQQWTRRRETMVKELRMALQKFSAQGIKAAPLKGAVLESLCYGGLGLREYGDIDILVSEADIGRAVALLNESGYATPGKAEVDRSGHSVEHIVKLVDGLWVSFDIHSHFDFPRRTTRGLEEVIDRCVQWPALVADGVRLSNEDLALHALVHLFKDETEYRLSIRSGKHRRLHRYIDLVVLGRTLTIDWVTVAQRACDYGMERALRYAGAVMELSYGWREMALTKGGVEEGAYWFLFDGEEIPWGAEWRDVMFRINDARPLVRRRVRDHMFKKMARQGVCKVRWVGESVEVQVPECSDARMWQLWVECDLDQHLYMQVITDLDDDQPRSRHGSVACERSAGWLVAKINVNAWPLAMWKGREIGVWSRLRGADGKLLSERRFVWVAE